MKITDLPAHAWHHISFISYIGIFAIISIVGLLLGHPEALYVWIILLFTGFKSDTDCKCKKCRDEVPPEEKESVNDIVKRKYVNGEISDNELDEMLDNINEIDETNEENIEKSLEYN